MVHIRMENRLYNTFSAIWIEFCVMFALECSILPCITVFRAVIKVDAASIC